MGAISIFRHKKLYLVLFIAILAAVSGWGQVFAATSSGSLGIEGEVNGKPPNAPTITFPTNGASFTELPIKVTGLCQTGSLVKIFKNNIFGGAATCANGSYSVEIDLFVGKNELIARAYDDLNQASANSNKVTVTFPVSQFSGINRISLSSAFAKKGARPGDKLSWPIILSGGNGPYAISVDWGDGTKTDIISQQFPGTFDISHVYKSSGIYNVLIRATDKNGEEAFLQLIGVGNGEIADKQSANSITKERTIVLWWPALLLIPLIAIAFWLGRKHEIFSLRRKLEQR